MSKLDGKTVLETPDGDYTLTFNVNTFCDLEETFEVADVNGVLAIIKGLETSPSLRTIRSIFFVSLKQEHPEITIGAVGEIISQVGINSAADSLMEAISDAFPEPDTSAEGKVKKQAGSGNKS